MDEFEVWAHRHITARFTVPNGKMRTELEEMIADKLRSYKELVWTNDAQGVNVDIISGTKILRLRRRFTLYDD